MTSKEEWAERIRNWRASGLSMADFCRKEPYTTSGLGYWIKRFEGKSTKASTKASPVRLARVVRSATPAPVEVTPSKSGSVRSSSEGSIVIEVVSVRAVVPSDLVGSQLDSVVASIARGWSGGRP